MGEGKATVVLYDCSYLFDYLSHQRDRVEN